MDVDYNVNWSFYTDPSVSITRAAFDVVETSDNGYVVVGLHQSASKLVDFYITKLTPDEECGGPPASFCDKAITVSCGQFLANQSTVSETNSIGSYPCVINASFPGKDRVYKITLTQTSDLQVGLEILTSGLDLDLFLLSNNCTTVTCLDNSIVSNTSTYNKEGIVKSLSAGTYYLVVDCYLASGAGTFNIDFACNELNCTSPTVLTCGTPYSGTTVGATNNVSIYKQTASMPDDVLNKNMDVNNAGPERLHRFTINQTQTVTITLSGLATGVDLEMFLLSSCSKNNCIAKSTNAAGVNEVISMSLNAGTYYVAVDGFRTSSGVYTLTVDCSGCTLPPPNNFSCSIVKLYYSGTGSNLQYTFTGTQSIAAGYSWKINGANVSGGTATTLNYNFPNPGTYQVCYPYLLPNGCVEYCCINACVANPFNCDGSISPAFDANANGWRFNLSGSGNSEIQWRNDATGLPAGSGVQSNLIPVPNPCNNTVAQSVSASYFDGSCYRVCCFRYYPCNPFNCGLITYSYDAAQSGFRFKLNTIGGFDPATITWTVDSPVTQSLGTGSDQSNLLPLPVNCAEYWVSVRFRDGLGSWVICCIKIYVCNPFNCFDFSYNYVPTGNGFQFILNQSGTSNVSWTVDDAPGGPLNIGNSATSSIYPVPGTCVERTITVRYFWNGRWYICCRKVWLCNPFDCFDFSYNYVSASNGYQFVLNQSGTSNISWTVDDAPGGPLNIGNTATSSVYPVPGTCVERTITVRYFWNGRWYICCRKVYICNPTQCNGEITHAWLPGGQLNVSVNAGFQNVQWKLSTGATLGTGNNITIPNPGPTAEICVFYRDAANIWRICCKTVGNPPNPASDLTFDIDDNICGGNNTVVQVPVRVKNFTNVTTFEMSLSVANGLVAQLQSILPGSLPGIGDFQVFNGTSGAFLWFNSTPVTVADNTVICTLNILLTGAASASTTLSLTGNPVPISAEQSIGGVFTAVVPMVLDGSVCVASNFAISGHILREDNAGVGNATVKLTGSATQTTSTDSQGNYAFSALAAGGNYIITPEKDLNDKNGVNGGDLVAIQRHILALAPLSSPYKRIAADADNSKSINGGDLVAIQRLILALDLTLPLNTSWQFVDQNHVFSNPNNPWTPQFPATLTYNNLSAAVTDADFVGVKIADVNLSNNPANFSGLATDERLETGLEMETDAPALDGSSKTLRLPVRVTKPYDLESFQFTLQFDPAVLRFKSLVGGERIAGFGEENFNATLSDEGYLSLVWAAPNGESLELGGGELLLWLEFELRTELSEAISLHDVLQLNGALTPAIATTLGGQEDGISLDFKKTAPGLLHYFIAPNPFSERAMLHLYLATEESVDVLLFNITGQKVFTQSAVLSAGYHAIPLDCRFCDETQMLFYEIRSADTQRAGKLLFLKN